MKKFIHQVTCVSDKFGLMKNKQTNNKKTIKEASSTPLLFEFSISFPPVHWWENWVKTQMLRLSNNMLLAPCKNSHTFILYNAVNTGKQSDTNSETSRFTHSLNLWLTDWLTHPLTHSQSTQAAPPFPAKMSFHSFIFSLALCFSIHCHIWGHLRHPLRCTRRHGTEGGVDSAGLASIVARWSVLLMSDWARHSAGVKREKHTTQFPMFPIPSVSCAACLWVRRRLWACLCVSASIRQNFFAWTEDVVGGF